MSKKTKLEKLKIKKKIFEMVSSLITVPILSIVIASGVMGVIALVNKIIGVYALNSSLYFTIILLTAVVVSTLHSFVRYNNYLKIDSIENEISDLENNNEKEFSKDKYIDEIRTRFNSLNNEHMVQVLNYINVNMPSVNGLEQINMLEQDDIIMLLSEVNKVYDLEDLFEYSRIKRK